MNKDVLKLAYFLKKFNSRFEKEKLRYVSLGRVFNSNFNFLKHLSSCKEFHEFPQKDLVLNYFLKSERLYPGSSYLTSAKLVEHLLGNYHKKELRKTGVNLETLRSYMLTKSKEEHVDLFLEILKFSGPDGTLKCKSTKNAEISVIKKNNPKFNIGIHESFRSVYFTNQNELTKNAIISVMDVYIERESELFVLLDYAKNNNVPVVLICRGMSDYCANHLKSILLRNKLAVYPYVAKFNDEDPFLFDDIASVLGVKKISSEFGDTINRNAIDKLSSKKVRIKSNEIEIFSPDKNIIKDLDEKIKQTSDNKLKEYLNKRKSRIKCNINEVLIPYDKIELLNEIKNLIVCYNYIAVNGLKNFEKELVSSQESAVSDKLSEDLSKTLNSIGYVLKLKGEQ